SQCLGPVTTRPFPRDPRRATGPSRVAVVCASPPSPQGDRPVKPYRPAPDPHPVREKFAQARKELSSCLIERDDEIDLVLTALLRILNERTFDAGDGVIRKVPLKLCVAASNEWASPDTGKELAALSDRFLLRKTVTPIRSHTGRERLLWAADHTPRFSGTI